MGSEFEKWYSNSKDKSASSAFAAGWMCQQSKVDELQKRVDAALIAFEKLKDEINELHGQCDLHLIKYLEEKAQVLEQALKGDQ